MRLRILLAYRGSNYSGWQIQESANPPPTIQGCLERALAVLNRSPVRVTGSGRTDAGVHALGQVAHCDVTGNLTGHAWRKGLNALLPSDIRVLETAEAQPHFHARMDARRKTYIYHFWQERDLLPPMLKDYIWSCGPLDLESMRTAMRALRGERDFAALQNRGAETCYTVRRIFSIGIEPMKQLEYWPAHRPMLRLTVTANGFLKQMVRNMAGLLAAAGQHRLAPAEIPALLDTRERRSLPSVTAPAAGLSLASVEY